MRTVRRLTNMELLRESRVSLAGYAAGGKSMRSYDEIHALASGRKGGPEALDALIAEHRPKSAAELAAIPDDRWLAKMSQCVFQAGFSWKVIQNKWPGFEEAFQGFDPRWCAFMSD